MKILDLKIADYFIDILRQDGIKTLMDIEGFEEKINACSPYLVDEAYLLVEGLKMRLFEVLLLGVKVSLSDYIQTLKIYMHLEEYEALFMVSVFSYVLEKMDYAYEIANIENLEIQLREQGELSKFPMIAFAYYQGQGVSQDYEKAYELFKEMEFEGNHELYYYLGHMNEEGLGTEVNLELAASYYLSGCQYQDDGCLWALGRLQMAKGETQEGLDLLKKSQDPRAYYDLFSFYEHLDDAQAFSYALKGALIYDTRCMYQVGIMYEKGIGTMRDDALALKYLSYAYYRFDAQAEKTLGQYLIDGHCGMQDVRLGESLISGRRMS